MISETVEKEVERIEKELMSKSDYLLNNSNHFNKKFRGNEDLDVNVFFLPNEQNNTVVHIYVGNEESKLLCRYIIRNKKLVRLEKRYGNGNKRIHLTHR